MRLKNRKSFFFIDFHSHRRAKGGKLHPFPIFADKQKACKRTVYRLLMEGVDTLDAPPTREPDLGHKKKSRLARLLRPLSKLFPYQFRML